jgi:hypothetical protein
MGQKRRFGDVRATSALPPKTDIHRERRHVSKVPRTEVADAVAASIWKSCFAETVDKHLSLPLTVTSYPFRYSEIGLNLKELGHRLPSFCI